MLAINIHMYNSRITIVLYKYDDYIFSATL